MFTVLQFDGTFWGYQTYRTSTDRSQNNIPVVYPAAASSGGDYDPITSGKCAGQFW